MTCRRCRGLMVVDQYIDIEETGALWMCAWRCVACDDVVDPEIMRRCAARHRIGRMLDAVRRVCRRRTYREIVRLTA